MTDKKNKCPICGVYQYGLYSGCACATQNKNPGNDPHICPTCGNTLMPEYMREQYTITLTYTDAYGGRKTMRQHISKREAYLENPPGGHIDIFKMIFTMRFEQMLEKFRRAPDPAAPEGQRGGPDGMKPGAPI
jgi:hypothetical protein